MWTYISQSELELYHHGVLGQKWGQRNGPPYPLSSGAHSSSEKDAGWQKSLSRDGTTDSQKKKKKSSTKPFSQEAYDELVEQTLKKVKFFPTKQQNYDRNQLMPMNMLPRTIAQCRKLGWDDGVASDCHQFTSKDKSNVKWVSPDGRLEVIFDANGKRVTASEDYGTYNYSDPITNPLGHFTQDVVPWLVWGNSPDDSTTRAQRFNAFFVNGTASMGKKVFHLKR